MINKGIEIANWLQDVLGSDYSVRYDDGESCMTRVIYKSLNKCIKEVPNSSLTGEINAYDFMACMEDRCEAMNREGA